MWHNPHTLIFFFYKKTKLLSKFEINIYKDNDQKYKMHKVLVIYVNTLLKSRIKTTKIVTCCVLTTIIIKIKLKNDKKCIMLSFIYTNIAQIKSK